MHGLHHVRFMAAPPSLQRGCRRVRRRAPMTMSRLPTAAAGAEVGLTGAERRAGRTRWRSVVDASAGPPLVMIQMMSKTLSV